MSVLKKIPKMNDNDLRQLFLNANHLIEKSKMVEQANAVIDAIESEWQRRLERFDKGLYKADTPEEGVLKAVGYKVGNDGVTHKIRHQLLDYVMTRSLPSIGSPAYLAEWGEPDTKERYRKLHRVIRVLASSGKKFQNMDTAVHQWEEDLEYLEEKYYQKYY
ncbi:hypothetical protein GCM10017044_03060 [Kordiimonas sediminis]|uniref:Uncharacterized protein n=1 Tax=Kordiimonas sediminis TaxID=1735581 RepID=A0A919AJJ1_9PROT|nr:hypothetical protein [Kordiimonas sediminis]GHF12495.1 hypothetical protein GCM10017044_03060 [Kordiimonas sediminis]